MSVKEEERWINAWNELENLVKESSPTLLSENYENITIDQAKELIQRYAYQGYEVSFRKEWFLGEAALMILKGSVVVKP